MKLIVGLGNPGPKYHGTRHNVGFDVVDEAAKRASVVFESAPADALIAKVRAKDIILVKPLTFAMNLSGEAVGGLLRYFRIDVPDLLVVVDEVHLPLGKLRARASGSAGGHNGLKSIIQHVGEEFGRLRLGVGRTATRGATSPTTCCRRFEKDEAADVRRMNLRARRAAADAFITGGIAAVMNQLRRRSGEQSRRQLRSHDTLPPFRWPHRFNDVHKGSSNGRSTIQAPSYVTTAPDTNEQQVAELHEQIEQVVARLNGNIEKEQKTGDAQSWRSEIGNHKEGDSRAGRVINGSGELMKELDRRLKVMDQVIRHMVVRVDEEKSVVDRTRTKRQSSSERRRVKRGLPPRLNGRPSARRPR